MERLGDCMYRQICKYEEECTDQCRRYLLTRHLLNMSNIPENKRCVNELIPAKQDVEAYKQLIDIKSNIEDFVFDGRILYLWSNNCGNGKTTWSIKLALQYINAIWNHYYENPACVFIPTADFLYKCKCFDNPSLVKEAQELRKKAEKAELVIFDDIACEYISKYDYAALLSLMDLLSVSGRAMIVTSNYSPQELQNILGNKIQSRLCNDYVIELKGNDRRDN